MTYTITSIDSDKVMAKECNKEGEMPQKTLEKYYSPTLSDDDMEELFQYDLLIWQQAEQLLRSFPITESEIFWSYIKDSFMNVEGKLIKVGDKISGTEVNGLLTNVKLLK